MSEEVAFVSFDSEELWYLQQKVRHEMQGMRDWEYPPASLELNSQIASALLFIHENDSDTAILQLSLKDCLIIDFLVTAGDKGREGNKVGDSILLKSFAARRDLGLSRQGFAIEERPETEFQPEQVKDALKKYDMITVTDTEEIQNASDRSDDCADQD